MLISVCDIILSMNFGKEKQKVEKIFVGMSGGVDSSVTALLLKNAGHNITGFFIKTWQPDYIECTWKEDRLDAMRVCAQLDIPFITLDLESEYKKFVIDYFLSEYKNNRTPNPDVMCNKYIKFGAFLDYAMSNGADYIATGHYAKIVKSSKIEKDSTERYELFAAEDKTKDQSYFLYQIQKENLSRILFPLANLEKSQIRKIAEENNLWVADKKDSQGICMLGGDVSVKDFLIRELNPEKGQTKNELGEIIGEHKGVILYTIGERHDFVINQKNSDKNENNTPYFVIEKDLENNVLIVSQDKLTQSVIYSKDNNLNNPDSNNKIYLEEVNILIDINNKKELEIFKNQVLARSRYRGELFEIKYNAEKQFFTTNSNILCVSGQSLVMYDKNNRVLGGGVIK